MATAQVSQCVLVRLTNSPAEPEYQKTFYEMCKVYNMENVQEFLDMYLASSKIFYIMADGNFKQFLLDHIGELKLSTHLILYVGRIASHMDDLTYMMDYCQVQAFDHDKDAIVRIMNQLKDLEGAEIDDPTGGLIDVARIIALGKSLSQSCG